MDFGQILFRLTDATRNGMQGVDRDKCLVNRDDLNELINQFLEVENALRNRTR